MALSCSQYMPFPPSTQQHNDLFTVLYLLPVTTLSAALKRIPQITGACEALLGEALVWLSYSALPAIQVLSSKDTHPSRCASLPSASLLWAWQLLLPFFLHHLSSHF